MTSLPPLAGTLLAEARVHERAGRVTPAHAAYDEAARVAEDAGDSAVLAQALRHLAVLAHHRSDSDGARALSLRSHAVATAAGDSLLAAQALNTMGGFAFEGGEMSLARTRYAEALELAGTTLDSAGFRARVEQNLGILCNIEGNHAGAMTHYGRALEACETIGDEPGCALALHNLGMVSADRREYDDAAAWFRRSRALAERLGDVHLQGLCLLNHAEVLIARGRFDEARDDVEAALAIFDRIDARLDKADAYRMLGMVFRETGRAPLAESRLNAARELAASTGSALSEAEACRELARLYRDQGRNQDALRMLNSAYRLFRRLNARVDLVDVGGKVADLEGTYLKVVREWGQSIEGADSYTHGHCERVARYALAVAGALGFEHEMLRTIELGAYLHDVGKVRVPHEVLNKAGRLSDAEFETIRMHPAWGVELLAEIDFPWDIKPIIRWHHERYDGTGYPDRLAGDEIPVSAQIICIVDVFDALTTARSYKPALSAEAALAEMATCRHWWRPDVYDAFCRSVGSGSGEYAASSVAA